MLIGISEKDSNDFIQKSAMLQLRIAGFYRIHVEKKMIFYGIIENEMIL